MDGGSDDVTESLLKPGDSSAGALSTSAGGAATPAKPGRRIFSSLRGIVKSDELPAMAGDFSHLINKHERDYLEVKRFNEKKRSVLSRRTDGDSDGSKVVETELESLQQILQYLPPAQLKKAHATLTDPPVGETPVLTDIELDFIQTAGMHGGSGQSGSKKKLSKKDKAKTKYYCDFFSDGTIALYKYLSPKKKGVLSLVKGSGTVESDSSDASAIKVLDHMLHATFIQRIITAEAAASDESYLSGGGSKATDAYDIHHAKVSGLFLSHLESIEASNSFKLFAMEGVYVCSAASDEDRSKVLRTVESQLKELFRAADQAANAASEMAAAVDASSSPAGEVKFTSDSGTGGTSSSSGGSGIIGSAAPRFSQTNDTWKAKIDAASHLLPLEMEQFEIQMLRHEQIMKSLTMTGLASSDSGILGSVYKTKSGVMKLLVPMNEDESAAAVASAAGTATASSSSSDGSGSSKAAGDSASPMTAPEPSAAAVSVPKKAPRMGRWEDQFFVITDDTLYWFDHDPKKKKTEHDSSDGGGAAGSSSSSSSSKKKGGDSSSLAGSSSGVSGAADDDLLVDSKMPNSFIPLKYVSVSIDKRRVRQDKFVFVIRSPLRSVSLKCKHPIALAEWLAAVSACNPQPELRRSSWDYLMEIRSIRSKASSLESLLKYETGIQYYRDFLRQHICEASGGIESAKGLDFTPMLRCFMALLHFKHSYTASSSVPGKPATVTSLPIGAAVAHAASADVSGSSVDDLNSPSSAEQVTAVGQGADEEEIWSDWDISSDEDDETSVIAPPDAATAESSPASSMLSPATSYGGQMGSPGGKRQTFGMAMNPDQSTSMISLIREARVIYNEFLTETKLPSKKERSRATVTDLEESGALDSALCIWKLPFLCEDSAAATAASESKTSEETGDVTDASGGDDKKTEEKEPETRGEIIEKLKRRFKMIFEEKSRRSAVSTGKRDSFVHFSTVLSRDVFDDLSDLLLDELINYYQLFVKFDNGKLFAEMSDVLDSDDKYKVLSMKRDIDSKLMVDGKHSLWLIMVPKKGSKSEIELKIAPSDTSSSSSSSKKGDSSAITGEGPSDRLLAGAGGSTASSEAVIPESERVIPKIVTLGRDVSNNIIIEDSHVSRSHGRIEYSKLPVTVADGTACDAALDALSDKDGKAFYCDLGSHHGSKLNGKRIIYEELFPGDVLTLGSCEITVEIRKAGSHSSSVSTSGGFISSLFSRMRKK